MTNLLPCPFCGREATVERLPGINMFCVSCENEGCLVSCETYDETLDEAIAAWNRRAPAIPLDTPDGPGYWAFEGKGQGDKTEFRAVNAVMGEIGALWSLRDNECKPVSFWTGRWWRLTMPWEGKP